MTVTLYTCTSENERLDKSSYLSGGTSFGFEFKDQSSVMSPSIIIGTSTNISAFNYAYIDTFGRYYYITEVIVLRADLYLLKLHADVLMTYRSQIRSCSAVCRRQENINNMYLDDPEFKVYNNKQIDCYKLSSPFTKNLEFLLVVAGN